jgi:hypothetical protein
MLKGKSVFVKLNIIYKKMLTLCNYFIWTYIVFVSCLDTGPECCKSEKNLPEYVMILTASRFLETHLNLNLKLVVSLELLIRVSAESLCEFMNTLRCTLSDSFWLRLLVECIYRVFRFVHCRLRVESAGRSSLFFFTFRVFLSLANYIVYITVLVK